MSSTSLDEQLQDLSSAEDFLDYFQIPYDRRVVQVNRLHILQRFHDYLAGAGERLPEAEAPRREVYRRLLARAYQDFVESDALTEKVFKVFHETHCGGASGDFVPVEELTRGAPRADGERGG